MDSRDLVIKVFNGEETGRVPLHLETLDKEFEAEFSDLVLGYAWIPQWSVFLREKGPFCRRNNQSIFEWADEMEIEKYEWPEVSYVVSSAVEKFKKQVSNYAKEKFVVFEVLGPTEQCEYMCAPEQFKPSTQTELSFHRFDFSSLTKLNPQKASELYSKVSKYILELIKVGLEIEWVDAVRVADDACSYSGPNYRPEFFMKLYFPWHKKFTAEIKREGKLSILHSDGDITRKNFITKLSKFYDALHPLDLSVKSTLSDALKWVDLVAKARQQVKETVFMTGLPVDLLFRDDLTPEHFLSIPEKLLKKHGKKKLVLSNTHRPYPGRTFREENVFEKILKLRRAWELWGRTN